MNNIDDIKRYIKKMILRIILMPLRGLKTDTKLIFLINDLSGNYSCNLKYIAEYMIKYKNYKLMYGIREKKDKELLEARGIIPININNINYFYNIMKAKVIITNSGGVSYIPIKDDQIVINTWHGGGAYKTCGIDMYQDTYFFRKDLLLSANVTNIFLSTNRKFSEVVSNAMLVNRSNFWEIGMPRNDILINLNSELINEIRNKIGLKERQRLVLYAPTYRKPNDNYFKESITMDYGIDVEKVRRALSKRFGGEWVFAYRLHPRITNKDNYILGEAMNLTEYSDMQELLMVSDVLINDFSSSFWDYLHTKRPCFMYAIDMEHYINTTEVYTPVGEWPFLKATTNEELVRNILEFNEEEYAFKCAEHYNTLGGCETGKATELVCQYIDEVCS